MRKQINLAFVTIIITTVMLLACRATSFVPSVPTPTSTPSENNIVTIDPENPDGYRLRRARNSGEEWFPYFCEVFLWPYNEERLNYLFSSLSQNGRSVEFIPDVLYEVEGDWILVLRGEDHMLNQLAGEIYIDYVGQDVRVRPDSAQAYKHPDCPPDIAFVVFNNPPEASGKVMSGFPTFQHAGGVADVSSEEEARQQDKVLRDVTDVIIGIQKTQQAPDAPPADEPVSVAVTGNDIAITNNTPEAIYYAAFPLEDLPLIEWAPCQHPDNCTQDRIEAGQSKRLSFQTVANADTTTVVVFWWHLVKNPEGSGYYNSDLSEIDVTIR